jgi:hypothetical protein
MTDVAVDTLRLRGPQARRLTAVAAGQLPAALERALADLGDLTLDRVSVTLDLDLDDYDDATLAMLWADAIRAGVLAARPGSPPTTARLAAAGPLAPRLRGTAEVLAAARTWRTVGSPGLPLALLALGEPAVARAVAAAAGPEEWARLVVALAERLGLVPGAGQGPAEPSARGPSAPAPSRDDGDLGEATTAAQPADRAPWPPPGDGAPSGAEPELAQPVQQALAALAGLAEASATDVDPTTLTRTAGLVLLYPWLAEHCRRAEDLHPGLDPLDVRESALALLVGEDPGLADDPLVTLLAGRRAPDPGERSRVPLPHADEVAASALGVLRSFAVLLPGFEESSPTFVREAWIVRLGLLDRSRDPVLLTATTHPLDVLLPLLPYPVGLVKLPWSPPLSVRFRP